jgi:HEAT repeat protein
MARLAAALWRVLPGVRTRERSRFLFFAGLVALISLAQTLGLAASEALFVAKLGAHALAPAYVAASLLTIVTSLYYAVRVGVQRNDRLFVRWLAGSALLLAALAAAALRDVPGVYPALFCVWYALQAVLLNHFWTFASDYFDTLASKRLFPLFTAGTSVGGMLGGLLAMLVVGLVGALGLVIAWALCLAATAVVVHLAYRPLRRWGPLVVDESDESSVEGLRSAVHFLGSSPLARWIVLSVLGMVLALFLAQYLYLEVFAESFHDPAELATFLSAYLAASNFFELGVELWLTPWLIRRIGVPGANLLHPLIMLSAFAGLAARWGLGAGVAARAARELAENAIAMPVRSLVMNAVPLRFRGRMRALLEGIVYYAGMLLAGGLLLAFPSPDPLWLCGAGALATLAYLLANLRTRRVYLDTLLAQLQAGRLDLADLGPGLGAWEASRLAALWEPLLRAGDARPSRSLLELAPHLAARGVLDPLVRAASHPQPEVRRASVAALASTGRATGPLALSLDDADAGVRLAALRGLAHPEADPALLAARVRTLLGDPDPGVRAEAALRAGEEGRAVLEQMLRSPHEADAVAALAVATPALAGAVEARARAGPAPVRAAALDCLGRIAASGNARAGLPTAELVSMLADEDATVRSAAVGLLSGRREPEVVDALARALDDASAAVRSAAIAELAARGADGIAAAEPRLRAEREHSVEASLRVLAGSHLRDSRAVLTYELRRLTLELWSLAISGQRLPDDPRPAARLLRIALEDGVARQRRLVFFLLALVERPAVVRKVQRGLADPSPRVRADALEVLSNLGDREAAQLLVLFHEDEPIEERAAALAGLVAVPVEPAEIVIAARRAPQRWIRSAARTLAPEEGDEPPEEETMERLLALQQVELLEKLSLEQLEAIALRAQEAEYLPGEVIVREGEPGDRLFLLLEGEVHVIKNHGAPQESLLRAMRAVAWFGEMAVLADEPRTATVVAATHSRLLSLDGDSLRDLILEHPAMSFAIFRVLTRRVRTAESRLADR